MANNAIHFINPHTGELRTAPVGYSWTVLFVWFLPPLIRSDWIKQLLWEYLAITEAH